MQIAVISSRSVLGHPQLTRCSNANGWLKAHDGGTVRSRPCAAFGSDRTVINPVPGGAANT
jgi:hypothetical protein